ncbi:MAG: Jag N-terminal domain-containing protein [Candidatus Omnitrophica bacterium]|nr:Jag N-terminal domain-containing protein [Candidatus Omnitrophota bacterium]MCG2706485.1 Jag N-terminal domain-containing protein [Candidatus Omnitrophota bacterium]
MRPDSSIEVEGKTVEEAIKKALKTLKLSKNQVKVEVLSEEKKGLFGMPGAKLAKIRVTVIKGKEESSEKL